jgi:formate hydrogenlyase subunit 3/multisubunit Na+/H+ antiporter MnhD subunit
LFPLHFWLPAAHGNAPGPVSAVLSALVVKVGFYLLLRYWFGVLDGAAGPAAYALVGLFGAVAVVWGGFQALAAPRLKLLVAYSTVAQLGYLFLAFPALAAASGSLVHEGVLYMALAHALAKGGAFLAAGTVLWAAGTDRMADLGGILRRMPVTAAALAIAGVSLIGMPPTGGFAGKWALLGGMAEQGRWGAVVVLLAGSLLTAGYIFRVLVQVFHNEAPTLELERRPGAAMGAGALLLALAALGMGFAAPLLEPLVLTEVGP